MKKCGEIDYHERGMHRFREVAFGSWIIGWFEERNAMNEPGGRHPLDTDF